MRLRFTSLATLALASAGTTPQRRDADPGNGTCSNEGFPPAYGDLEEFLDYDYIARVAKVDLAAMWSLANAPATVRDVKIDSAEIFNDNTLFWTVSDSPDLAGYEIVWRPTDAPLWTHSLYVGKVGRVTVQLSIDNVIFGVRAVGTNGYKSPATIPFPSS
ncbi:hypothetical protein MAPG_01314 [Magnaporthiopsis poae ATCC 64411]|uniref:Fibronectin type-III domain-containing protein n=1 Tax=Magnaporthiopsis poae (strain ATCC 64411 / 73-15) TaxID=644358 RepID=A0A0C4DND4_MAGP6|nr:hypothetical protein MAPG_01314 [Magnaporthiopsis poae ATCC 64411]